jgi:hypothetical protein
LHFLLFASGQRWKRLPKTKWAQDEVADDLFDLFEACVASDNGYQYDVLPQAPFII